MCSRNVLRGVAGLVLFCSPAVAQVGAGQGGAPPEAVRFAVLKSDLRNLVTAQEAYFADHATYAGNVTALNYSPSSGVAIYLGVVTGTGWNGLARYQGTATTCGIFVGSAPAPIPGQREGEPRCDGEVMPGAAAVAPAPGGPGSAEAAYLAAMRSDLRNLVTAEEAYFADHVTYTSTLTALNYSPSSGVTITLGVASGKGWNATARHAATAKVCGIFVGDAPAPVAGQNEGEPVCR